MQLYNMVLAPNIARTSPEDKQQARVSPIVGWVDLPLGFPRKLHTFSTQDTVKRDVHRENEAGRVQCLSSCTHSPSWAHHSTNEARRVLHLCPSPYYFHFSSQEPGQGQCLSPVPSRG